MAKIYIEPAKARAILSQQIALEQALQALSQDVGGIRRGLNYKISGREAIDARLRDAVNQLGKEVGNTKAMRAGLEQIIAHYEQAENSNIDRVAAEKMSIQNGGIGNNIVITNPGWIVGPVIRVDPWKTIFDSIKAIIDRITQTVPPPWYWNLFQPATSTVIIGSLAGTITSGLGYVEGENFGDDTKIGTYKNTITKIDRDGSKFYWDPNSKKMTRVDPNNKEANETFSKHNKGLPVDVKLMSVGASRGISAAALDAELAGDYAGISSKTRVGELKGEISGYAGLLGVGGTIGGSFTAFSNETQGYLGSDDLQVYGKVGVTAGKVELKGSVDAGLVDKDGKFNPSLQVGGSAEAIAGEVSGTIGGKVAGADVSVTGKLNYGVGAHANIGYKDGKLSVDIGATLGVGGSVKLDIDVSDMVNAVAEDAKNIWSGVKNGIGKLKFW